MASHYNKSNIGGDLYTTNCTKQVSCATLTTICTLKRAGASSTASYYPLTQSFAYTILARKKQLRRLTCPPVSSTA
jgi:hypothetical protein